jgi:aspartate/glutamate racemase
MKSVDIVSSLYPLLEHDGDDHWLISLMNTLRRLAEYGGHFPILQSNTTHCFTEELGSQMPIETICTLIAPFLKTTKHYVCEAAEALAAVLARYGVSSSFCELTIFHPYS